MPDITISITDTEQKALETTHLARSNGHPLNVEIETA